MNTKDVLIGMGIGVAVGAMTTLLSTPKSGKELRGNIGEKTTTVKDKTTTIAHTVSEQTGQVKILLKESANQIKNETKISVPYLSQTSEDQHNFLSNK